MKTLRDDPASELTKREHFAAGAMQGLLAMGGGPAVAVAHDAVALADLLVDALNGYLVAPTPVEPPAEAVP